LIVGIVNQTLGSVSRRGILSRLRHDRSGSTIIEFAFVAGPFIALILAILQTAMIFFANQLLDTATQSVSRLVLTGQAQQNGQNVAGLTKAQFKTQACNRLREGAKFFDCDQLTVDVTRVGSNNASFATANMAAPNITYVGGTPTMNNRYETGDRGDIIMIRLTYPWNVVGAPGLNMASMQNGQFLLMSTILTRTEPYSQ
jgi:Flp pilus assembly protein TadG